MKGDDFINSVELIFFGLGVNDLYQANVKIYDGDCLIVNKCTYNGRLCVSLNSNKRYLLVASSKYSTINRNIMILPGLSKYYFAFSNAYYNLNINIITLLLTDANYIGLPITKGEMILWQK